MDWARLLAYTTGTVDQELLLGVVAGTKGGSTAAVYST